MTFLASKNPRSEASKRPRLDSSPKPAPSPDKILFYDALHFLRVYPGPLGRANQLGQILAQEVRHACSVFLWYSVSVMHDGTEHFLDRPTSVLDTVAHPSACG